MSKYKIVYYWPSDIWAVKEQIESDGKTDWMEVHRCESKGENGYNEAKKWLKDNDL